MTVEEYDEYRLMSKRPGARSWKESGSRGGIRSLSVAQARVDNYQSEYGSTGWQFKVQVRKVKIESTPWKDAV